MNTVYSPMFETDVAASLNCEFESDRIIKLYRTLNLNVDRFFEDEKFYLYKCVQTGYRFYYPFSCIGDAEFYKNLSLVRKDYYSDRWEHEVALNLLSIEDNVLEIGSGFGSFLKRLKEKGISAEGIELNPEAIQKCKKENLVIHDDLIEKFILNKNHLNQYSVVCFFQVLEHISHVYPFLNNSLNTLKVGGKLIIGVPNNNPYLFINDKYHTLNLPPHHAGLWNKKALMALCDIFPLEVEEIYYEPLALNYGVFINSYLKNSNFMIRQGLRLLLKLSPRLLKKIVCKFIHGRNILIVFKKLGNE